MPTYTHEDRYYRGEDGNHVECCIGGTLFDPVELPDLCALDEYVDARMDDLVEATDWDFSSGVMLTGRCIETDEPWDYLYHGGHPSGD